MRSTTRRFLSARLMAFVGVLSYALHLMHYAVIETLDFHGVRGPTSKLDSAPHRPLPIALEQITRDWLTAALRTRAADVGVREFKVVDVVHSTKGVS